MSAGGDNAETRSASGFHPDVQRSALRDVVALATVCTDGQIRAERDYETALRERRAALEKTVADIEQRFAEAAAAVEQQYHEMLTKIAAQYEADMATLRASEDSARHRIDADRAAASQEVSRKLKDAEWMAVSLFEGTQARLREEAKAAQKTFASQRALIEDMEQRAAALAYQYGLAWQPTGATGEGAESEEIGRAHV